jgi:Fur family transcriptional regulator, ferric uptake regulator
MPDGSEKQKSQELYTQALEHFTDYLRRNSLKMTRERRLILKEIFFADTHLEAEDLLMRFRRKGEKVSRATIYRTFDLLIKADLIDRSDFGHNHYHYEKTFGRKHHDHMICENTGEVIEFRDPRLEELLVEICKKHNFTMKSRSLQIFGECAGKK